MVCGLRRRACAAAPGMTIDASTHLPRSAAALPSRLVCLLICLLAAGCAMPHELNLSPVYRHRLDDRGEVLELDVAWPIVHYERTPTGGSDFRIRPLWRRVHEGERTEHQFLWPFGRIIADAEEVDARLFPLWTYRDRTNGFGHRELEWEAPYPIPLFPFFAGGVERGEDGVAQSYFGLYPLYADLRGYLTYDRYRAILFPLYAGTRKGDKFAHTFLFWLAGFGGQERENGLRWHRFLPFYAWLTEPGVRRAGALLWPLLTWGSEKLDTEDPVHRWLLWPLLGRQRSESGSTWGWSFAWPFFQQLVVGERFHRLELPWPIFRYLRDDHPDRPFKQWWLWPFVMRTDSLHHKAWGFLWPLFWWREFQDPDGEQRQLWALPLIWWVARDYKDGTEDRFFKLWPLFHVDSRRDDTGDWSALSPWPWRAGNALGMEEAYGFLWTLAGGRRYARDDRGMHLFGNLYTQRQRGARSYASVPFLFSWEGDAAGGTLRLLQVLPIRFGEPVRSGEGASR